MNALALSARAARIAALRARMRGERSSDGGTEGRGDGHDGSCEWEAIFGGRQEGLRCLSKSRVYRNSSYESRPRVCHMHFTARRLSP